MRHPLYTLTAILCSAAIPAISALAQDVSSDPAAPADASANAPADAPADVPADEPENDPLNAVVKLWKKAVIDLPTLLICLAVMAGSLLTSLSPAVFVLLAGLVGLGVKVWGARK